jgi:hypothetical protein
MVLTKGYTLPGQAEWKAFATVIAQRKQPWAISMRAGPQMPLVRAVAGSHHNPSLFLPWEKLAAWLADSHHPPACLLRAILGKPAVENHRAL